MSIRGRALIFVLFTLTIAAVDRASAQSFPSGWGTADIGAVGAPGSATGDGAAFTVNGAGADIWGSADAFRFVYRTLSGDGSLVAKVTGVQNVASWTKAGVMMRDTLAPGAPQALMLVSAGKGLAFQRRSAANGPSTSTAGVNGQAPYFVKLTRAGNTFTAFSSPDGATWTRVDAETIAMAPTIDIGLAVSSHVAGRLATATFASVATTGSTSAPTATTETIVFLRHGEKPSGGYGQLTCQGLQRALALPPVLTGRFGAAQAVFAPNPVPQVDDAAGNFDYVRPLATIEPTAIALGLPVHAQIGYTNVAALQNAVLDNAYASATLFVAWEHVTLQAVVQRIMDAYDSGVTVPAWPSGDFDSLYLVRLTNAGGTITAQFEHDFEGLNNLPATCP